MMSFGTADSSIDWDTSGGEPYWRFLQTSEVERLPWAQEIEGKVNVFNKPVEEFLNVFVPGRGPSDHKKASRNAFERNNDRVDETLDLIRGLRNLVGAFDAVTKPAFDVGRRCRDPFPYKDWDIEECYQMPGIVMSHPGNIGTQWASAWRGISTVFEFGGYASEDPVDEDNATIKAGKSHTTTMIQISKSARNLLHTHRLLYAYVVGIFHTDKARIFRFDHAAGVVSKAIDLREEPYLLYDFLWRFCHYKHPHHLALTPPHTVVSAPAEAIGRPLTRSVTKTTRCATGSRVFLGMDPTVSLASEQDCNKIDELLRASDPPQEPLTAKERDSCRWVALTTEHNPDESAKRIRWYILYRSRFLNPRLFSRVTRVWDAYDAERWERRVVKDAWRQLARDREDVLYTRLRDELRKRDDLGKLVEECKNFGLPRDDASSNTDGDDPRSDAAPPSTAAADNESEYELNSVGTAILAEGLSASSDTPLYGLPDFEVGDDLGACEARKLWNDQLGGSRSSTPSPSDTDLDSLAQGEGDRPPMYGVYHRTNSAWLRQADRSKARFNERSHMRLVMKTVGRPLSSFKSTKEMVTAIRDAIIGHMLAFKAGLIHRDFSDGNVMIMDGGWFQGFLLDLDYAFDWFEALEMAGVDTTDEAAWARFVDQHNSKVVRYRRFGLSSQRNKISALFGKDADLPRTPARVSWKERMQMKERTGTLFFTALQVLKTYRAHDVSHDLESAVWLLLCIVLRHTLQVIQGDDGDDPLELERYELYWGLFADGVTEKSSYEKKLSFVLDPLEWEVKDNEPLTALIDSLKMLVKKQNRHPEMGDKDPVPLTYRSILTEFNRALARPNWPENDAALRFRLTLDDNSSESRGKKRERGSEDEHAGSDNDASSILPQRETKRLRAEPSLLHDQVGGDPFQADSDDN